MSVKSDIILLSVERRGAVPKKKMGRPTDEPKPYRLDVRVSKKDLEILDDYCKRKDVKRPQGIRDGIKSLKDK